jgi:iron complex outermembrane receptor protein
MLALAVSLLVDHQPVEGQQPDPPDGPVAIEGITVDATPVEGEKAEAQTSFVTVIEGKDLEQRFTSIPEVLSETVGVQVSRFGGLGDFSAISIRGSSSEQVLIYLDGILLNEAQGGGVNLGTIPMSNIESIEIYRGSSPILFGQTGIGGIVNIKTKSARGKKVFSARAQYGSYDTYRLDALFSDKPGRLDYMLGVNYTISKNNFKFLNDNGTQFNPSDDVFMERQNNQFESFNLVGRIGYDFTKDTRLSLYHNFLQTDKGVPGLGAFQSLHANFKTS